MLAESLDQLQSAVVRKCRNGSDSDLLPKYLPHEPRIKCESQGHAFLSFHGFNRFECFGSESEAIVVAADHGVYSVRELAGASVVKRDMWVERKMGFAPHVLQFGRAAVKKNRILAGVEEIADAVYRNCVPHNLPAYGCHVDPLLIGPPDGQVSPLLLSGITDEPDGIHAIGKDFFPNVKDVKDFHFYTIKKRMSSCSCTDEARNE